MSEAVEVTFDPPRRVRESGKVYVLSTEGKDEMILPISASTLRMNDGLATGATLPRFIAEDRGLVARAAVPQENMTRRDLYLLGLIMAFIIRGDQPRDAAWEASKLADWLLDNEAE